MIDAAAIEAVVFDLDGTLIDTEPYYRQAFHAAAAIFGQPVPDALYASLVGVATPERKPRLREAFGADFPVEAFISAYYEERARLLPARIPLRPGAASLLRRLRRPVAIATSASRRTATTNLTRAGIADWFVHVITRDDIARGKPAPDAFLLAARRLGVAPRACLAVEDSPTGVAAALEAGMSVAMVGGAEPQAGERVTSVAELSVVEAFLGPGFSRQTFRSGFIAGADPGLRNPG